MKAATLLACGLIFFGILTGVSLWLIRKANQPKPWVLSSTDCAAFIARHGADIDTIAALSMKPTSYHDQQVQTLVKTMEKDGVLEGVVTYGTSSTDGNTTTFDDTCMPILNYRMQHSRHTEVLDDHLSLPAKRKDLAIEASTGWVFFPDVGKWQKIVDLKGEIKNGENSESSWELKVDAEEAIGQASKLNN
jgi:hypothetical protein